LSTQFSLDPEFDPHTYAFPFGHGPASADRKFPPASTLYPNLADYARIRDVDRYYSAEFMQREWDHLWTRSWTCAGRTSDIPNPGQYFRYDLGRESFIVTRGQDNVIRAFYNTCQHRGRHLIDNDFGTCTRFVCPFHSWAYDLTGKNVRVTDRGTFKESTLEGDLNLKPVRCETWAGFVFINMDPAAPPLLEFLAEVPELMSAYRMEDMHVVKDAVLEIDCNWKTGLEPFIESYHVHITHPQALRILNDVYEQYDVFRNGHARLATPLVSPSPRTGRSNELNEGIKFFLAEAGIDPTTFQGTIEDAREAIWQAKRRPDNRYGLDFTRFTKSQVLDDWNYFIFPNMTLNTHPEGVLVMRFLPHATNPEKFYYHVHVILPRLKEGVKAPFYMGVPDDADVSGRTRPAREWTTMAQPKMGEILEQDISNMVATQRGLRSKGFASGMRFAERELRVQVFHAELDAYLSGHKW
jgi:phenylpropionate dioxygenase-like ring-hydroxylating dioxygenase large terminal subunit